jgi:hypothetical protein
MEQKSKTLREKVWSFADDPFTWGGIGMIVGAVAVGLSLKAMFIVGFFPIAIAVIRRGFFSESRAALKVCPLKKRKSHCLP